MTGLPLRGVRGALCGAAVVFLGLPLGGCGMIWDLPEPLEDQGAEDARDDADVRLDVPGEADVRADGELDVAQDDDAGGEVPDDGGDAPPIEDRAREDRHPPRD